MLHKEEDVLSKSTCSLITRHHLAICTHENSENEHSCISMSQKSIMHEGPNDFTNNMNQTSLSIIIWFLCFVRDQGQCFHAHSHMLQMLGIANCHTAIYLSILM